ncbi:MAG TPA: tetratricopeptide repeat protein, partial [Blastocatellia bacterium]|nr:tetratricopeptide repeat protein [Blastocatellia bacterium]
METNGTGMTTRIGAAAVLLLLVFTIVEAQEGASAEHYLRQGVSRFKAGDLDGAIADFSRAIAIRSRHGKAYKSGDGIRSFAADTEVGTFKSEVAAVDPFTALAYYNRGIAWSARGELDKAAADFDRAIRINPLYTDAYIRRGRCRHARGDLERAVADYTKAISLDPSSAFAYNNRGIARQAREDLAGAVSDFDKAILI